MGKKSSEQTVLIKGDTWYLVDSIWYEKLKKYLSLDDSDGMGGINPRDHPGPIDNKHLFDENQDTPGEIMDGLIEDLDYVLLPMYRWNALVEEFSLTIGQKPIARKVIEQGKIVKHCKVEVY